MTLLEARRAVVTRAGNRICRQKVLVCLCEGARVGVLDCDAEAVQGTVAEVDVAGDSASLGGLSSERTVRDRCGSGRGRRLRGI